MELEEIIIHEFLNYKKEGKKNPRQIIRINEIIKEWLGNNLDIKILCEKKEFIKEKYNLYWDVESQQFLFE